MRNLRILLWALVAVAAVGLAVLALAPGRQGPGEARQDMIASFGGPFTLTGADGKPFSSASLAGKPHAIFFGFTHCPDVCPTTLARLVRLRRQIGGERPFEILFVTVDPERDTAELLRQYVPAFNSSFLGLRPDPAQLKNLAAEYKVVFQKNPGRKQGDYLMDHSAGTYVYDTEGRLRLLMPYGSSAQLIASDLKTLLPHR